MKSILHKHILFGAPFIVASLLGCSHEKNAGVETTNGFNVSVTLQDGTPAKGARYYLVNQAQWNSLVSQQLSPILDSGVLDDQGKTSFDSLPANTGLEVYGPEQCGRILIQDSSLYQNITLSVPSKLSGSYSGSAKTVYIAGTSLSATVQADGSFSFPQVPPGTYGILVRTDAYLQPDFATELASGEEKIVDGISTIPNSILLEDFNDGDRAHRFAALTGNPVWFWGSDSISSLTELPRDPEGNFRNALTDTAAWNGLSLHVHANVDDTISNRYANVGLNFLSENYPAGRWINLCAMDSLTFWTKGSGSVIFQFATPLYDENPSASILYGKIIDLDSIWKQVTILPGEIQPLSGRTISVDSPTWVEQCSARNFTITFDGTTEFWMDDISIFGSDVVRQFQGYVTSSN